MKLLLIFLQDYANDDIVSYNADSDYEKLNDLSAIIYVINLISEDLLRVRNEYYDYLVAKKYTND